MSVPAETKVVTHFLAYVDELLHAVADLPEIHQEQKQLYHACLNSLWQMLNNAFQHDGQRLLSAQQVQLLQMVDREIHQNEEGISVEFCDQLRRLLREMPQDLVP